MTEDRVNEIVDALTKSLQARDYDRFVSFFAEDAVFEIPFTVDGGTVLKGLAAIKEHFEGVRRSPVLKLIELESVSPVVHHCAADGTATVEYFSKGRAVGTGQAFEIQSSIAVIRFDGHSIVHYKDIPNTLGLAKKAGVLAQLAASWSR